MSMKLGFRQVLVISSANVIREIMKSHDLAFSGRPVLVSTQKLSYNGVDLAFSSYNEMWKEMRKVFHLHLFSIKHVQTFVPICKDEVSRMIKKISVDASMSRTLNLSEMMTSLSSNTICRLAFGKSYDEGYGKNRFFDLLCETQEIFGGLFVEDYLPSLRWIDKISGKRAKLEKNFKDLDCFYQELIEEHLDSNRPKAMQGDIVDLLLGLKRDESSSVDLSLDHIKALIMNILTGGTETSAATLVWAMTALMKNPKIMKKLQAEIRQLGANKEMIEEEQTAKLPYLKAVIKETFRLQPANPLLIPRETIQKCTLNGYEIQPGTLVYFNAWAIARDPEFWENPNEFLPERFLETDVDVRGRDAEVIPFGIGRRGCPGIAIAMAEVELALANLLYRFDWELPHGMQPADIDFDVLPGMTAHKKNPLCLIAKVVHS
ncbi:Cytochrome P450 CYP2 subfamily [Handroanthus impetiginosus]|uniref:Cytochrome P450 CYP2 subfamily n=1 Tax=Handroanthus impetiginosus TaxID=429701 RepID=A0A2G9GWX7_9LAMI|nr:Cytochrome P450 CYP2 subfamily [Handroanthus impetiginosus]